MFLSRGLSYIGNLVIPEWKALIFCSDLTKFGVGRKSHPRILGRIGLKVKGVQKQEQSQAAKASTSFPPPDTPILYGETHPHCLAWQNMHILRIIGLKLRASDSLKCFALKRGSCHSENAGPRSLCWATLTRLTGFSTLDWFYPLLITYIVPRSHFFKAMVSRLFGDESWFCFDPDWALRTSVMSATEWIA